MSDDAYEKRMQEMEDEFNEWWDEPDDPDEPFFSGVSREVAYEIWEVAYRRGGYRPWTSMTTTQIEMFKKLIMGKPPKSKGDSK